MKSRKFLNKAEKIKIQEIVNNILNKTKEYCIVANEDKVFFIGTHRDLVQLTFDIITQEYSIQELTKDDIEAIFGAVMSDCHLSLKNILHYRDDYSEFKKSL